MGKRSKRLIEKILERLDSAEKSSQPMRDLISDLRTICDEVEPKRKAKEVSDDGYFPIGGNGLLAGMRSLNRRR